LLKPKGLVTCHRGSKWLLERPWNKFSTVCLRDGIEIGDVRVQMLRTAKLTLRTSGSVLNAPQRMVSCRPVRMFFGRSARISGQVWTAMESCCSIWWTTFFCSLDRLGAQIWITIQTSPSGIAFKRYSRCTPNAFRHSPKPTRV
jgi:hypothetical protein